MQTPDLLIAEEEMSLYLERSTFDILILTIKSLLIGQTFTSRVPACDTCALAFDFLCLLQETLTRKVSSLLLKFIIWEFEHRNEYPETHTLYHRKGPNCHLLLTRRRQWWDCPQEATDWLGTWGSLLKWTCGNPRSPVWPATHCQVLKFIGNQNWLMSNVGGLLAWK